MSNANPIERYRPWALVAILLAGTAWFGHFVHGFYAIQTWLFWRYAGYVLVTLSWSVCCLSFGYELVARYCRWLSKTEQLTVGLALGVLGFALAIFGLGLVHALHWTTALLLPVVFMAVGARRLRHDGRKLLRRARLGVRRTFDLRWLPVWLLGLLGVGLIYFMLLSPEAFTFDARWYHMPIAERYAHSGKVGRFDEGFWMAAFPQLLSYLYTWAFLLPGTLVFDRMELGGHIEFVLFVATLTQIPLVVRRLAPGAPWQLSWCIRLAFPSIYLYDGNLNAGADHVAGFFALPLALNMLRAWPRFEARRVALAAVFISAIALVKYTSWAVCASAGLMLVGRGLWIVARGPRRLGALQSLGALGGVVLLVTATHWLKNLIWYHDPLYPQLAGLFPSQPWGPEFAARRADLDAIRRGASLDWPGLREALKSTVTFSFIPNDWEFLHRDLPVFGSLFTLTLPCLLVLKRAGKLWGIYLGTMLAIVFWYMLAHYDRYLQAIVPLMAAGTAACLARIWQLGLTARTAVTGLVGLQVIWGLDVPFIRTHNQIGDSPIRHVAQFLASGFERRAGRLHLFQPLPAIGRATPRDAVVLLHEMGLSMGLDRNWVADQNQSLISYGRLATPRAIHEQLRALGVTHLVWPASSYGSDSLAGDLAFYGYASRYPIERQEVAGHTVSTLPPNPPPRTMADPPVAIYGCGSSPYSSGWYRLSALNRQLPGMPPARAEAGLKDEQDVTARAEYVVVDRKCHSGVSVDTQTFELASRRRTSELYVRRQPLPE